MTQCASSVKYPLLDKSCRTPEAIDSSEDQEHFDKRVEDESTQYSFFPIEYPELDELLTKHYQAFWTPEVIDFSADREHFDKLSSDTQQFIKFWLAFFSEADGIICENLQKHFQDETSYIKEAARFYACQNLMEVLHNKTYGLMIQTIIRDSEERERLTHAIKSFPEIRALANWIFKWMDSSIPINKRIVAFACVEGIFFTGAFCAIYWLKRKNILPGLTFANELIARDEALHTRFAVTLYHVRTTVRRDSVALTDNDIHEVIISAVQTISSFIQSSLRVDLIGMSSKEMIEYVKCTANSLAESFGSRKMYDVTNPYRWMAVISLPNKSNFFEKRVSEYARQTSAKFNYDENTDF
jgi:ribonucleoside-diphosphate reductase subunit M2